MEHRCNRRMAVALPAQVRTARGEMIPGTIRDLSCGGAFLSVPQRYEFPRGMIEVHVRLPYDEPQNCRWRAYVVHQQDGGIGVMFDERHLGDLLPYIAAQSIGMRTTGRTVVRRVGTRAGPVREQSAGR